MIFVFPVESYVREIAWRIHFACYLLERHPNSVVYIAESSKALKAACLAGPNAVYIGKHIYSVNPHSLHKESSWYDKLIASGCNIIFVEEEGGIFLKNNFDQDRKLWINRVPYNLVDVDTFDTIHWGDYQKELTKTIFGGTRHWVGGAPSIDSCIVTADAALRTKKNQNQTIEVGIMSKGGIGSYFKDIKQYYQLSLKGNSDALVLNSKSKLIQDECDIFQELGILSEFLSPASIQFRPHPSLAQLMPPKGNSCTLSDSTTIPINTFLKSKSLVVHNGCTTAVQAWFMDVPTVSTTPNDSFLLSDYTEVAQRKSLYQKLSHEGQYVNPVASLGKTFCSPFLKSLISNQHGRLNAFAALEASASQFLKPGSDPLKKLVSVIDLMLSIHSRLYRKKRLFSIKKVHKFASISMVDVEAFIHEWNTSSFAQSAPKAVSLGDLAVRISL